MSFSLPANAPLLLAFGDLPDPRKQRNRSYPLIDIIAVTIMGIIADANDFIATYKVGLLPTGVAYLGWAMFERSSFPRHPQQSISSS